MRGRIAALAVASLVATCCLVAGSSTTAAALTSRTEEITCEIAHPNGDYRYTFTAVGYYSDDTLGAGVRHWLKFRYRLAGGYHDSATKSNVNIRLREDDRLVYSFDSRDDRRYLVDYEHVPAWTVRTSKWGPNGERDHRTNDFLSFESIFDVRGQSDPKCTAQGRF